MKYSSGDGKNIPPDPEVALFGSLESASRYISEEQMSLMLGMVAAKTCILLDWKSPTPAMLSEIAQQNDHHTDGENMPLQI